MPALTILQRCFTTVTFWPLAATTMAVNLVALNCSECLPKATGKARVIRPLLLILEATDVTRWDEKAGLQTGCCTLPSYLSTCSEAQEIKETGNEEG